MWAVIWEPLLDNEWDWQDQSRGKAVGSNLGMKIQQDYWLNMQANKEEITWFFLSSPSFKDRRIVLDAVFFVMLNVNEFPAVSKLVVSW